jgi:hypothetical protein
MLSPNTNDFAGGPSMVKVWIHKLGGTDPLLATEMSLSDCTAQFDLDRAKFMQPLGEHPPSPSEPGPLGADPNPELVVFEVLADEQSGRITPGYYASAMTADTVQTLLASD